MYIPRWVFQYKSIYNFVSMGGGTWDTRRTWMGIPSQANGVAGLTRYLSPPAQWEIRLLWVYPEV